MTTEDEVPMPDDKPGGKPQDITGSGGITLPPLTPPKDDDE